jgi:hypothetical protein
MLVTPLRLLRAVIMLVGSIAMIAPPCLGLEVANCATVVCISGERDIPHDLLVKDRLVLYRNKAL